MTKRSLGVSTNSVFQAKTTKEKADQKERKKAIREARQRDKRIGNTVYGAMTYKCSNADCRNTLRVHEEMGERRVLCSKCNNGFFTQLIKDDRKNLARADDFKKHKRI